MDFDLLIKKKKLVLVGKDLHDADLATVAEVLLKSEILVEINLMCNHVTLADGKFTDALAKNRTLKVLSLYNNQIGVEGAINLAEALKANDTLEQVFLEGNKVGDDGSRALADALMSNAALQCMILRGNGIGDDGATCLANSFLFNRSLRVILLGENKITNAGAQRLADAIEHNTVIDQLLLDANQISPIMDLKIKTILGSPSRKDPNKQKSLPKSVVETLLAQKDKELDNKNKKIISLMEALAAQQSAQQELSRMGDEKIKSLMEALVAQQEESKVSAEAARLLEQKDEEIKTKDEEIKTKDEEIKIMAGKITRREHALKAKVVELKKKDGHLATLKAMQDDPVKMLRLYVANKDTEISGLKDTIQDMKAMEEARQAEEEEEEEEDEEEEEEGPIAHDELEESSSEESEASEESDASEETDDASEETDHTDENREPPHQETTTGKGVLKSNITVQYSSNKQVVGLE